MVARKAVDLLLGQPDAVVGKDQRWRLAGPIVDLNGHFALEGGVEVLPGPDGIDPVLEEFPAKDFWTAVQMMGQQVNQAPQVDLELVVHERFPQRSYSGYRTDYDGVWFAVKQSRASRGSRRAGGVSPGSRRAGGVSPRSFFVFLPGDLFPRSVFVLRHLTVPARLKLRHLTVPARLKLRHLTLPARLKLLHLTVPSRLKLLHLTVEARQQNATYLLESPRVAGIKEHGTSCWIAQGENGVAMRAQLVPLDGGPPIDISKDLVVVGRKEECDLRLDHKSVSKMHCIIVKTDGLLLLRDLGSTNGTRVNGIRVRRAALLPNDQLTIANYKFRILLGPDAPPPPANAHEHTQAIDADEVAEILRQARNNPEADEPSDVQNIPLQRNQLPDVYDDESPGKNK